MTSKNLSATSGWIHWQSTGVSFNIEYDTTGYIQGNGTLTTSLVDSVELTSLTPNTNYDVYVQNNCTGAGNGSSTWSGPYTFTTLCSAFSLPFTENFEGIPSGSSSNPAFPNCWNYLRSNNGGSGYIYNYNNATYANSGTQALYCYTSSDYTYGDTMVVVSPEIQDMDSIDVQVEFYARARYNVRS